MTEPEALEIPESLGRLNRLNLRLVIALCAALLVAVFAVVVAVSYKHSNEALRGEVRTSKLSAQTSAQAKQIAACVNAILATRSVPTADDNAATVAFYDALDTLLTLPASQQSAYYPTFLTVLHRSKATLQNDAALRAANPLGRC